MATHNLCENIQPLPRKCSFSRGIFSALLAGDLHRSYFELQFLEFLCGLTNFVLKNDTLIADKLENFAKKH